ncbi:hypothetical protein MMC17_005395 [Xylographa soralifera]|nr:hypothetical protein [Xylographa soralifera]
MSFGVGVGDIITVTNLAWNTVQHEVADPDSIINRSNDDNARELAQLVAGCKDMLEEVDLIILKYNALGDGKHGKGKRAWQKIKFGNNEMQELTELRQKLSHHTASITVFLNLLSIGSQRRVEKQMIHQGGDLNELRLTVNSMLARMMSKDQSAEGSVLTIFSGDDQSVWKSFRRELIKDGYDSSVISQHMDTIKAYIEELADKGVIDEPYEINQEQILQPTVDEYTQKQLARDRWQKISKHEPQNLVISGLASPEFVPEFDRISRMHNSTDTALPKLNDGGKSCLMTSDNNGAEHKSTSLRLKKLWPETESMDFNSTFNIITISEGQDNPFSTTSWHRVYTDLSAIITECQVFRYDYQISDSTGRVWVSLVYQGQLLLETIFGHKNGSLSQPLMFLCYGLGGLVLKRALTLAYEKPLDPASQFLVAMNAGIVLLGTPHPLYIDCSQWARLHLILKSNTSISQSFLADAGRDVARMANVSSGFDKLRLEVPVISVYESKESRIRVNYWRSIKVVLVGRSLASTSQRSQTLIGIDSDHAQLCRLSTENTSFRYALNTLVTAISRKGFDKAPDNDSELRQLRPLSCKPSRHIEVFAQSYPTPYSDQMDCGSRYSESARLLLGRRKSKYLAGVVGQGVEVDLEPPIIVSSRRPKLSPKLPCYVIQQKSTNPDFWGRRDILTQIDDILLPIKHVPAATTRSLCVVLGGLGGIGKTQIAMHYALTRKTKFDAIFWVQANNDAMIAQGFTNIAENLGLVSSSETSDPVFCRSVALEWLSLPIKSISSQEGSSAPATTGASYLLVFDNADDPEITRQYWPILKTGAILITSRCPWMSQNHYQSIHVQVEPLSPVDGGAMLRKLVVSDDSSENAKSSVTLAAKLGGHPLAIAQLAGLIISKDLTIERSLDIYEKEDVCAFSRWPSQPTSTEDSSMCSIFTVWDRSLGDLSTEATSLLQTISFLESGCISEHIWLTELNATIRLPYAQTDEAYSKAREELQFSSFIQRFVESEEISIHCLVQKVVIHRMSDTDKLAAFGRAVYLVRQVWPHGKHWFLGNPHPQASLERLVPHVQKLKLEYEKMDATGLNLETNIAMAELLQISGW